MTTRKRLSTDPLQPPQEAGTLGFLLREVYGQLQETVYAQVAAAGHPGLRPAHSPVLRHLPATGGRVANLARATGLAKQSVAYLIEDLVDQSYLKVAPDPEDGRARRILYTPKGLKLLEALVDASIEAENRLASRLGTRRVDSLRAILEAALRAD